jgi:hypothetical protein
MIEEEVGVEEEVETTPAEVDSDPPVEEDPDAE